MTTPQLKALIARLRKEARVEAADSKAHYLNGGPGMSIAALGIATGLRRAANLLARAGKNRRKKK